MCICYSGAADRAQGRWDTLNDKMTQYSAASEALNSLLSAADSYIAFFEQLHGVFSELRINGAAYDRGRCAEIASELTTAKGQINDIITAIESEIRKFLVDMSKEQAIINRRNWCCNYHYSLLHAMEE